MVCVCAFFSLITKNWMNFVLVLYIKIYKISYVVRMSYDDLQSLLLSWYCYTSILFRLPHEIFSLLRPPSRCRLLDATAAATRLGIGDRLWCKMSLLMPLRMNRGLCGTGSPFGAPVVRRGVRRNEGMRLFKSVTCGMPISVVEPIFWTGGKPFINVPLNGCGWGWRFIWFRRLCCSVPGDASQLLFWMWACWWWFSEMLFGPGAIDVGRKRNSITVRF